MMMKKYLLIGGLIVLILAALIFVFLRQSDAQDSRTSYYENTIKKIFDSSDLEHLKWIATPISKEGIDGTAIHFKIVINEGEKGAGEGSRKKILREFEDYNRYHESNFSDFEKSATKIGWLFDDSGLPKVFFRITSDGEFLLYFSGFSKKGHGFLIVVPT